MVKITLITGGPKVVEIVSENTTLREFLENHNVNYGAATTTLDGAPQYTEGLDATFAEHHVTTSAIVTCLANKDNGAQAIVVGSSCVIKSTLTPDQIKKVKKLHPEALEMYDDNDEPCFKIDIDEETPGNISEYGACFGNATSSDGKATITVVMDPTIEDTVGVVRDKLGHALLNLEEMEAHVTEILPELAEEEAKINSMIIRM